VGSEQVTIRSPKNKSERMLAAVASTDGDLYEHNGRILVTGKVRGDVVYLGSVSLGAVWQKNVDARFLIDRVRFGWDANPRKRRGL